MKKPLKGTEFHTLSPLAKEILWSILNKAMPVHEVNPEMAARFRVGGLVVEQEYPNPYKSHRGKTCPHFFITVKGRKELGL